MFYLANYLFSHQDFSLETRGITEQIKQGNLTPLFDHAEKAYNNLSCRALFSQLGFGIIPVNFSNYINHSHTHQNPLIGQCLSWLLLQYLTPLDFHLGYNWNQVSSYLSQIGWPKSKLNLLIHGLPLGNLLGIKIKPKTLITDSDPYWYWIRPLYSYNQGGYIPYEKCSELLTQLKIESIVEMEEKNNNQVNSIKTGVKNIVSCLEKAVGSSIGLFSAIYWDWGNPIQ